MALGLQTLRLRLEAMVLILFFLLLPLLVAAGEALLLDLALRELAKVAALEVAEVCKLVPPLVERERRIKVLLVVEQLQVLPQLRCKVVAVVHQRLGSMAVVMLVVVLAVLGLLHPLQAHL